MANKIEQDSIYPSFVDARISFSNEFADSSNQILQHTFSSISSQEHTKYKEAPVSSDFNFNVENYGLVSAADEIFFGGVLLPMEKTNDQRKVVKTTTTLRDEIISGQDSDRTVSKGFRSNWWKLGLNKSKKIHYNNNNNIVKFDSHITKKSQNCLASILESDD
ncbi:unnamed protein product [Cochlearia groenlandica]